MTMDVDATDVPLLEAKTEEQLLQQVIAIKNRVIGNKRQKMSLINQGIVHQLLSILNDEEQTDSVRIHSVIVLGSLSKGPDEHVFSILSSGAIETLIRGLGYANTKYVELCLCCLRSLVQSPVCPKDFIYSDPATVPHLLSLVDISITAQTCVATILAECCQKVEQQNYLHSRRTVEILYPGLLYSGILKTEHAILQLYTRLSYQNRIVSTQMLTATINGVDLKRSILRHLGRDRPLSTRLLAAKCLVNMYRSESLVSSDPCITLRVLPTLVTLCKADRSINERLEGAEMIAYLTELDVDLQKQASITDHCIPVLATYLKVKTTPVGSPVKDFQQNRLRRACLSAFASLSANDEEIRKRIIETDNIMDEISRGLSSQSDELQLAALRCLHSLSRSVQQLRTIFQDHAVWKPLMSILRREECEELMSVASSTLCNLLLEFSPSKEQILDLGAMELLVSLTFSSRTSLRLNAVWGLMNMMFQADQKVKGQLITKLGSDQLFCLLRDPIPDIVMKTLGLLRNLLSPKRDIDDIMRQSGEQVIQAVVMILESDHTAEIKEQTLCILGNVADGDSSKDYIMNNDDILKKVLDYMQHTSVKLQTAALICVNNLIWSTDSGHQERRHKLQSIGVCKIIEQLEHSKDKALADSAKTTLCQFEGAEAK